MTDGGGKGEDSGEMRNKMEQGNPRDPAEHNSVSLYFKNTDKALGL